MTIDETFLEHTVDYSMSSKLSVRITFHTFFSPLSSARLLTHTEHKFVFIALINIIFGRHGL